MTDKEKKKMYQSQVLLLSRITNAFENFKKRGKESMTSGNARARIAQLESNYQTFLSQHDIITEQNLLEDEHVYFIDAVPDKTEEAYYTSLGQFNDFIESLSPKREVVSDGRVSHEPSQTPKLKLPTFSGDQSEWESFRQRFTSMVARNPRISDVDKLQHLLGVLEGKAAQRVKGIEITGPNFNVAWEKLQRRYNNSRIRLSTQLEALIQLPAVNKKHAEELSLLLDKAEEAVTALKDLGCPLDQYDHWLVHCVSRKLDSKTRESWKESQEDNEGFSTYAALTQFLERRIQTLDDNPALSPAVPLASASAKSARKTKSVSANSAQVANSSGTNPSSSCSICAESHKAASCPRFSDMSTSQRFDFCKREKLCLNCLQRSHFLDKCPSKYRCRICKGKHHTKLHIDAEKSAPKSAVLDGSSGSSTSSAIEVTETAAHCSNVVLANSSTVVSTILLATARIILADELGNSVEVKALIDPGAERCFIAERVLSHLATPRKRIAVSVVGVGAEPSLRSTSEVNLILRSPTTSNFELTISALVLPQLTRCLPQRKVEKKNWPHLQGLQLADPTCLKPSRVDCILGADAYSAVIRDGLKKGSTSAPVAQNSVFGWVLTGSVTDGIASQAIVRAYHTFTESTISQQIQRFWEIEEIPAKGFLTPDEQNCEELFEQTHFRESNGRFVVRLPFKQKPKFVGSRDIAVASFLRLEKRLQKNPQLAQAYHDFLTEYENLGHMKPVDISGNQQDGYYMPHHAVVRPENPTKIRVVFNASQRASNGISLNDVLLPGRKLQQDISIIITNWRFLKFVFKTDMVKMFRQTKVHPEDHKWQRIVWRPAPDQPLQDYEATTVTYGTAPAPYLALRSLQQLAEGGKDTHPDASKAIKKKFYVDDGYEGADEIGIALQRRDQLIELLASACIPLDKWASNEPQLLEGVVPDESPEVSLDFDQVVSALGLKWLPGPDSFVFRPNEVASSAITTKRNILSEISRLFDPLGWIAPIIIVAKIILQDLWLSQVDWDTEIAGELSQRWRDFSEDLRTIATLRIPRWLGGSENGAWELHGFADASKRAYAACVYYVLPGVTSVLLMAKTRVAPTKVQTLPRLELCGAVLLVRLSLHFTENALRPPKAVHFWTDSQVVLDWLKGHPSRWPTFVANRTSEILTKFPRAQWRHVKSQENPADCATRGLTPDQLKEHPLWWNGPTWLAKREAVHVLVAQEANLIPSITDEVECFPASLKFSNFNQCIRTLAYVWRWKLNAKPELEKRSTKHLTVQEMALARQACFKAIQLHHFADERRRLSANHLLPARNPLARLSPFLCKEGLIRVGGRLQNAPLPYDERHPVILPQRCEMVYRLVEDAHRRTLHGGVQLMRSYLYRFTWIIQGQNVFRRVLHKCTVCARFGARRLQQQMAPLPAVRLQPSRPFLATGLDYAGPIPVLFSKGRGAKSTKGYVAIFICMITRAVHVEIVSDLSTKTFMAAFERFTARRGLCATLYSDNATTFRGASVELASLFEQSSEFSKEVTGRLAAKGTEWKFIPPRAPHFGGLWEAAVRSFKHHFKRVIGEATLTHEEWSTLATKIEACLNSRPLCPLSSQGDDDVALTPAHFLVGTSLLAPVAPIDQGLRPSRLNDRWNLITQMRDAFWKRWRTEALHHLQQRHKWLKPQPNIQEGDVLIPDELTPPTRWPLGRVITVHPGDDKLVRVATLKTASTELTRAVESLILLPRDDEAVEAYRDHQALNTTASPVDQED